MKYEQTLKAIARPEEIFPPYSLRTQNHCGSPWICILSQDLGPNFYYTSSGNSGVQTNIVNAVEPIPPDPHNTFEIDTGL